MFDDHDDKMLGTTRCFPDKNVLIIWCFWLVECLGLLVKSGFGWNHRCGSGEIQRFAAVIAICRPPEFTFSWEFGMFLSFEAAQKKTMIKFIIIWTEDLILWMSIVAVVVPSLFDILGCNPEIIGESPISWYFLPPQKVMPSSYKLVYEPMN